MATQLSSSEEQHQQREDLGQNRHAFEQEERQVHGAGDLVGGARLARDALGGGGRELADAQRRAMTIMPSPIATPKKCRFPVIRLCLRNSLSQ